MMMETPRPQFPTRKPVLGSPVTHPQMAFAVRGERAERRLVQQLVAQPPEEALHESATMFLEFTITLAADAQDGIVGCASRANRQDRIGRSTLARKETHQPSAYNGCMPLRAKATHREPQQLLRLCV